MSVIYDRVCRLCLSSRGELMPIFHTTSSDSPGSLVLASKIEACVSIQINENDELPTGVCKKCLDNVNNWHIFKKVCERAQDKLQALSKKDEDETDEVKVKSEPLSDEAYDDGVVIDGSYPDYEQNATASKVQPEGPPILASLGLTPRSDKGVESEKEEEDEYDEEASESAQFAPKVPNMPEVSITVMRPTGETLHARQGIQQLASKNCLVCGRAYRYSHNARRHELTAHSFDRYTNKITNKKNSAHMQPKLRPNPFNPKARLMPNPISHRMPLLPKSMPSKMVPHKVIPQPRPVPKLINAKALQNNLPYPLRIKALKDLQVKKEPQILKTLLTSKPEVLVSEPEIVNSAPESPETLISEPEIASFQVETILSEQENFDNAGDDEEMDETQKTNHNTYDTVDMESDNEIEIAREKDDAVEVDANAKCDDEIENDQTSSDNEHNPEDKISDHEGDMENEHILPDDLDTEAIKHVDADEKQEDKTSEDIDDKVDDDQEVPEENEEDDEMNPMELAPVVEINEDIQNSYNSEGNEDDDEIDPTAKDDLDEEEEEEKELDPNKVYVTKTQKEFIDKYRDIIEQINTKRCLCCDKEHPRRKAVIQHLQKNGHKVPKHTCYNCVVTFSQIGALLSHMRASVCTNLWKVIYNEDGITDDMVIEDEPKDTKVQYKDIFNARSYACKLCPAKFQLKQFILKHVLDVHEDGQSHVHLACVHCGSRFKDRSVWKRHVRKGECAIYISCDFCAEKFGTVQDFNDHALAVHAGSFDQSNDNQSKCVDGRPTDCPLCGKKNSNYPNLVRHLRIFHDEDKPHFCKHCDAKFEQTADLNNHIYLEHSDKALGTHTAEADSAIVKEEVEEYHYSCTECNAIFETVDAWTDHQVAEHNQVAHHCDQCDKKFLRPSELAEHKNTHLRVKFYPCSVCSNSYSTPQKLSEHVQQAHPGVSGFVSGDCEFFCDICIRSFKSRQAYSNHMRIHAKTPTTNRRPGDSKAFSQVIGKQIKPYPLAQPSGGFANVKPNCNVPNAPYSCDICGKGFMHKKNIWKHKKVLHADLVSDRNDSEENTMHASTEDDEFNNDENGALTTPQFNSFNFSNFVNNVQQTPEVMPYACDICFKKFPLKTSMWKHKRAKHGIINASSTNSNEMGMQSSESTSSRSSCTICKITFSDKKSYYRHRKNVHKSNVQMCKICGKPLNSTLELYEHLKAAHARELLGYNANQGASKPQETASTEAEIEFEGDQDSGDPSADYQARYPCDTCGKHFVGLLALQNHQCINQGSQPQTFDCEICHKSYTSIAALKSHRGWHLRSPDGKAAANNSGLWMPQHKVTTKVSKHEIVDPSQLARVTHVTTPASIAKRRLPPEVEVTVVNPNKKLRSDDSIEIDQGSMQVGVDDRYCNICDKEFTKRAAYQRHMDEVHQPNSVFCPVCDKSFTRKSTLLVHMRKHYEGTESTGSAGASTQAAEDEIHACDLCGAQYHTLKALKAHRARHHGEESADSDDDDGSIAPPAPRGEFTCAQCGDGVATPRDLIAHRTMHATPTKFFCNICKVYFGRALDLSSHTRSRHADNEKVFFPCAMCERFYMNKKSLQRHIEMAH